MDLNDRLERIYKQTGWSQAELARRIDCSRQMLSSVKSGANFGRKKLARLAEIEAEIATPCEVRDEETSPYTVPALCTCPGCQAKDRQIAALNNQLDQAHAIALALAEAGRANHTVTPASGAGSGCHHKKPAPERSAQ